MLTILEAVLLTVAGTEALLLLGLGAALWHQEKLLVAQLRWFQDQLGRGTTGKDVR